MSNFFQDTWNGIKEIGSEASSAIGHTIINADFNGAATTFSNKSKDQLNAVIDRSPASNSTDLMELTLEMSVAGYCKFNEKMRTYMNRLMKINVDQLSKTLGNTGKGAYMYGDSATISNEVKSYSYVKSVNYVDSFAKKAMIDRKGKSDSTVTKTEYTKEYPYEERTNLYPDDLEQGHSNFRQWEKWNVSNKNSILYKTKKLFEQRKINTIISRFGTNADGSSHGVDYIGSVRTKFGESRGRNLLKAEAEDYRVLNWSYAVNGYNNPYCRVWTHHHQYNYWTRTMRPFSTETLSQAGDGIFSAKMISPGEFHKWKTFQKESGNSAYRTYKGGDEGREYSVLDTSRGGDGLVKITPKYQGGEAKNIHTKDCMFSIENLAWRGYDPYAFENALSWEQRGPLGGRIMWFPPYGIQFSESTNVKWSSNTFIGRGEDVYTYINTSRAGTLSFLMVVDHPSIINYAMWNNGLDKQHSETDLLRFFAGCDSLDPTDTHSIMSKIQPTPLTDEWIKNDVDDPDDVIYQARQNTDQGAIYAYSGESKVILNKYVALFFPNNFTGKDAENNDNLLMQVLFYLFAGKGLGYFGTYKSEQHLPPEGLTAYNELFKVIKGARKDGSDENHYGYQMKHGILTTDSKGISDIDDKREARGGGYFYVWVDEAKINNTLRIIGNEKNNKKMSGGDWVTFGVNENLSNNNKFAIKINESQTIPSSEILTLYELLEMWSGDHKVGEGGLNLNSNTERVEITPLAGFESWWSTDKDNYPLPAYRLNTLTSALNKIFSQIKTVDSKQIYVTENPQKDSYRWMYDNKYTDTEAILKIAMHNSIEAILNRSAICQVKCYSKGDKKYYLTSASSRSVQENVMKGYNVTIEEVIRKIYYEVSLPSVQGGNDKTVMWELKPINEILVSLMSSWSLNEYTDKANEIVFGENDDFIVQGNRVTSLKVNNNECAFVVDTSAQDGEGPRVTEYQDPVQTEDKLFWYKTKKINEELQLQICAPVPLTIGVVNHLLSSTSMEDGSVHTVVVGETTIKYVYHEGATSYCIYNNNELLYTTDYNYILTEYSSSKRIVFTNITFGELEKGERILMSDSTYKYIISTKNYINGNNTYITNKEYDVLEESEKADFTELKGDESVLIIKRVEQTRNNISGNTNEQVNNTETNTIIPRTTNQDGGSGEDTPSSDPVKMSVLEFMNKCFEKKTCNGKDIFLPVYIRCQYGGFNKMFGIKSSKVDMANGKYGGKCYTIKDNSFVLEGEGNNLFTINKIDFYTYSADSNDVGKAHVILYTNNAESLSEAMKSAMTDNDFSGSNLPIIEVRGNQVVFHVNCIMSNFKENKYKNVVVYLRDENENDCWGYTTDNDLSKRKTCYFIEDNGLFGDKTIARIIDDVFFVKYVDTGTRYIQFQNKPPQTNDEGRNPSENVQGTPKGNQDPSNTKKDAVNGIGDNMGNPGGDNGCVEPAKQTRDDKPITDNSGKPNENGVAMTGGAPSPAPEGVVTNNKPNVNNMPVFNGDVAFNIDSDILPHNTPFQITANKTTNGSCSDNLIALYGGATDSYGENDLEKLEKKLKDKPLSVNELFTIAFKVDNKIYKPSGMTTYQISDKFETQVSINADGSLSCGIRFKVTDMDGILIESAVFNENVTSLRMHDDDNYIYAIIQITPPGSGTDLAEVVINSAPPGSGVRKVPIDRNNKYAFCVDESGRKHRGNEKNVFRYDQEYYFFKALQMTDKLAYTQLVEKIRYFDPAFHSMTPEGFNARLTFLNQCTRQGMTKSASDYNVQTANNMAFGRPPFCVLRMGDFYNQMIVIDSINIDYSVSEGIQWDMNTEGIGMQPLLARVDINFKFIGGGDIQGPIRRLQNAMTFNYYANTRFYDNRADRVRYGESTYDYKAMGAIDYSVNYNDSMSYVTKMRNKN